MKGGLFYINMDNNEMRQYFLHPSRSDPYMVKNAASLKFSVGMHKLAYEANGLRNNNFFLKPRNVMYLKDMVDILYSLSDGWGIPREDIILLQRGKRVQGMEIVSENMIVSISTQIINDNNNNLLYYGYNNTNLDDMDYESTIKQPSDMAEIKGLVISMDYCPDKVDDDFLFQVCNELYFDVSASLDDIGDDSTVNIKYAFAMGSYTDQRIANFNKINFNDIVDNYEIRVQEQYNKTVSIINDEETKNGLVILNGPPGTGKTHMIKAMLSEVKRKPIICIPSSFYLENLGHLSNLLVSEKSSIVILEDVGDLLYEDASTRYTMLLSNLLNQTDGLLGLLANTVLVVTFNYNIEKVNEALLRPGRCLGRIEMGALTYEQSQKRVGDDYTLQNRPYTLAEIYDILRHGQQEVGNVTTTPKQNNWNSALMPR